MARRHQRMYSVCAFPYSRLNPEGSRRDQISADAQRSGSIPHRPQRVVEKAVDVVLDEIVTAMVRKDRVELRGFGAFSRQG